MNEKGTLTLVLLDALREARDRMERGEIIGEPEQLPRLLSGRFKSPDEIGDPVAVRRVAERSLDELIEGGERIFFPLWQDAVHRGGRAALSPTAGDAGGAQQGWQAWTQLGLPMVSAVGAPEARRRWRDEPPVKWARSGP